jgi:hypothetical protein
MSEMRTHFGDPCIHCGTPPDELKPGACEGTGAAIPIAYAGLGVRWDGVEHYRVRYSDGSVSDIHRHVSEHAPYYHFGTSASLIQPPRYDEKLRRTTP